jgi:hypothetical protein
MDKIQRYAQNIRQIKRPLRKFRTTEHTTQLQDHPMSAAVAPTPQSMEPTDVLSYAKELGIFLQKPMVDRIWSRIIPPFPKLDSPLTCPYKPL